jgi:hypothetical protein
MTHDAPPPGWSQRAGRIVPFPAGLDDDSFEIVLDGTGPGKLGTYQLNERTLEVFERRGDRWYQPMWGELPPRVQSRVWQASQRASG